MSIEGGASDQFLEEINFKLDLMPCLTETLEKTLSEVLTKVTSVESQLAAINEKLAGNARANEEMKKEIKVLRKYLSAASQRSDALKE